MKDIKIKVRKKLEKCIRRQSYSINDVEELAGLYTSGQENVRSELRDILDVPSTNEVILN